MPAPRSAPSRLLVCARAGIAALIAALTLGAATARAIVREPSAGPSVTILPPGAERSVGIAAAGGETFVLQPPRDPARVIVQFRSPPRLAATDRRAAMTAIARDHSVFTADLGRLAAELGASSPARVTRSYRAAFNGVAVTAPAALVERLRELPYVRAVVPDDSVTIQLEASVPLIGADLVWTRYGVTGAGVDVAIIDTGVDYNHPAFGGGFGPGNRVVGGYDFVNDDADPMDDHFHGTHVAGIVGADGGGLKGVAPGASLHAYKVLDQNGGGVWSTVIAAIERSLDPDQDPLTDDALDVLNFSLAGPGDADHPASQAINVASAAGVVCVVAAGNRGGHLTIGVPAAARDAITVGASDKRDVMAPFSSRGPLTGSYALKPDLVAPGVSIFSAIPRGGMVALSGTSMASPHVAGAAALLLEAHPGWSPARVKSAVMNTARTITGGIVERGAGRLDVPAAIDPGFTLTPPSISVARPPSSGAPFDEVRPIVLHNLSAQAFTVDLSVDVAAMPGLGARIEPAATTLAPGDSAIVTLTLTIDPVTLPYPESAPFLMGGEVVARSGAREHRVTFGFVRGIEITLGGPDLPAFAFVHDRLEARWGWTAASGPPLALLRPGRYDLVGSFFPTLGEPTAFVVREDLLLEHDQEVTLARADATYSLLIDPVDEQGREVDVEAGALTLWMDRVFAIRLPGFLGEFRCTPLSSAYNLEWDHFSYVRGTAFHDYRGTIRGLGQSMVFRNAPADIRSFPIEISADPSEYRQGFHHRWVRMGSGIVGFESNFDVEGNLREVANITPRTDHSLGLGFSKNVARPRVYNSIEPPESFTPVFDLVTPDRVHGAFGFGPGDRIYDLPARGFRFDLNEGPPLWIGRLSYNASTLYLSGQHGLRSRVFTSPLGGVVTEEDPRFWIEQNGAAVDSGTVTGAGEAIPALAEFRHALPGGGPTRVVVESAPYTLYGAAGRARVEADLAIGAGDAYLPHIRQIMLTADGQRADSIAFDRVTTAELRFKAFDDAGPARLTAWVAPSGTADWRTIGTSAADTVLVAALPDTLHGMIALRVEAMDVAGNRLTYTADPGFRSNARLAAVVGAAQVSADPRRVELLWRVPSGSSAGFPVYRRTLHTDWERVGEGNADPGGDVVRYADANVVAGRRYEYALGVPTAAGEALAGATVVDVPGARAALFGILPNPGPGNLRVSFSLGSAAPASLELVDVTGRRLRQVEVGHLGAGEHALDLGAGLEVRAGVYWVRLRQSGVTEVMRAAVIR